MPSYTPSPSPPPTPSRRRMKTCARACERACCAVATYFPLAFVYSLTTWAAWTEVRIAFGTHRSRQVWWLIEAAAVLGFFLYAMANISYTVAAFTDPGSPLKSPEAGKRQGKYSILPTAEPSLANQPVNNITVSSTGAPRYCKKCHTPKPDRTHHCSTCKRCVLKMDHHCPWLATCLGLHNYKAFVLFLIYTSLLCWVCFGLSAWWMWKELFENNGYLDELPQVSIVLLSVISGIIGLVLTGFTSWHIYLCIRGHTTIEKLEKTRYLSAVRSRVEQNRQRSNLASHAHRGSETIPERIQRAGEQILEFHANAVPGASRYEEGEEHSSPTPGSEFHPPQPYATDPSDTPAVRSLRRTYSSLERSRDRQRYTSYLDDRESESMPNAFDLGWRRNLGHLFGPSPLLWWLPVCNTTGDGWRWEVSDAWVQAQKEAAERKERRLQAMGNTHPRYNYDQAHDMRIRGGEVHYSDDHGYVHQDEYGFGRSAMSMQTLQGQDGYAGQHPRHAYEPNDAERGRRRQRRDFDRVDGVAEPFEVSSDSDSDPEFGHDHDARKGR